jgi:hypothetical protein
MRLSALAFASVALAARPFLNEPDTGIVMRSVAWSPMALFLL